MSARSLAGRFPFKQITFKGQLQEIMCPLCKDGFYYNNGGLNIGVCNVCESQLSSDKLVYTTFYCIEQVICEQAGIPVYDIHQPNRRQKFVEARRLIVLGMFQFTSLSSSKISAICSQGYDSKGHGFTEDNIRWTRIEAQDLYARDVKYRIHVDNVLHKALMRILSTWLRTTTMPNLRIREAVKYIGTITGKSDAECLSIVSNLTEILDPDGVLA